jgi:hypothetical protein
MDQKRGTTPADVKEALDSASACMTTHPRDWAQDSRDAWLWGLIVGWGEPALQELVNKFGWQTREVERLGLLRDALLDATMPNQDEEIDRMMTKLGILTTQEEYLSRFRRFEIVINRLMQEARRDRPDPY